MTLPKSAIGILILPLFFIGLNGYTAGLAAEKTARESCPTEASFMLPGLGSLLGMLKSGSREIASAEVKPVMKTPAVPVPGQDDFERDCAEQGGRVSPALELATLANGEAKRSPGAVLPYLCCSVDTGWRSEP